MKKIGYFALLALLLGVFPLAPVNAMASRVGPELPLEIVHIDQRDPQPTDVTYISTSEDENAYRVPGDGFITSFKVQAGDEHSQFGSRVELKILRRIPGSYVIVAGSSSYDIQPNTTNEYPIPRISVQAGDQIALTVRKGSLFEVAARGGDGDSVRIYEDDGYVGRRLDDEAADYTAGGAVLAYNAEYEPPLPLPGQPQPSSDGTGSSGVTNTSSSSSNFTPPSTVGPNIKRAPLAITKLKVTPAKVKVRLCKQKKPKLSRKRKCLPKKARVLVKLNRAASVSLSVYRINSKKRKKGKGAKRRGAIKRQILVRRITRKVGATQAKIKLSAALPIKAKKGKYKIVAIATDSTGLKSTPKIAKFKIK